MPTRSRHRARLLVATCVAAVLAGATIALTAVDRTPASLPAAHFRGQLQPCLGDVDGELTTDAATAACLRDVLVRADRLGSLSAARRALAELVAARPSLHNSCHLAEHEAGELVLDDPDEAADLLTANLDNVCSWGFGHGVLETFGAMRPSPSQWRRVIDACRATQGTEVYALCADGVGHAAWDDTTSLAGAARRCHELGDAAAENACAGGVLMQRFRPAERSGGTSPALPDLTGFCDRSWPSPTSRAGCAAGLGYVLAMGLVGDPVAAALLDGVRDLSAQRLAAQAAAAGLRESLVVCASLLTNADDCSVTVIQHLPRHLLEDREALEVLCADLPERWRASCAARD